MHHISTASLKHMSQTMSTQWNSSLGQTTVHNNYPQVDASGGRKFFFQTPCSPDRFHLHSQSHSVETLFFLQVVGRPYQWLWKFSRELQNLNTFKVGFVKYCWWFTTLNIWRFRENVYNYSIIKILILLFWVFARCWIKCYVI